MKTAEQFGRDVELSQVAIINPVHRELYGTTKFELNGKALSRLFLDAGYTAGYSEAAEVVQQRIHTANSK